jgi:hypothetical protein
MALNFYDLPWNLDADACPCDVHLNEYLEKHEVSGRSIFHFGTGVHHVVGLDNVARGNPNHILGITASKAEYNAYIDLVLEKPELALAYKVLFADVYSLNEDLLPPFDVVTLFHLGEYWTGSGQGMHGNPAPDTPLSDKDLLYLFLRKLDSRGRLLLYSGSAGRERIGPIIQSALERGDLVNYSSFMTLEIFGLGPRWSRGLFGRLKSRIGLD